MLLFYKPMCVFFVRTRILHGSTRKGTQCENGFAHKSTYVIEAAYAYEVRLCS